MQKHRAIEPFVEYLMGRESPSAWRNQLSARQIFTVKELERLSDQEITLVQRALLMQRYVNLTHTQFMQEVERHNFNYSFDMGDDDVYRAGVVCY